MKLRASENPLSIPIRVRSWVEILSSSLLRLSGKAFSDIVTALLREHRAYLYRTCSSASCSADCTVQHMQRHFDSQASTILSMQSLHEAVRAHETGMIVGLNSIVVHHSGISAAFCRTRFSKKKKGDLPCCFLTLSTSSTHCILAHGESDALRGKTRKGHQ